MARPPLALGTPGNITVTAYGDKFIARCWYRDYDGTTRKIERHGRTKTAARTRLHDALGPDARGHDRTAAPARSV